MNYFRWTNTESDAASVASDDTDMLINTTCNVTVSDVEDPKTSKFFADQQTTVQKEDKLRAKSPHRKAVSFGENRGRSRGDTYHLQDNLILSLSFDKMDEKVKEGQEILKRLLSKPSKRRPPQRSIYTRTKAEEEYAAQKLIEKYAPEHARTLPEKYATERVLPDRPSSRGRSLSPPRKLETKKKESRPRSSLGTREEKCDDEAGVHVDPPVYKKDEDLLSDLLASFRLHDLKLSQQHSTEEKPANNSEEEDLPTVYLQSSIKEEDGKKKEAEDEEKPDPLLCSFTSTTSAQNIEEQTQSISENLHFLQEVHEKETSSLHGTVDLLRQQKRALLDHSRQLKDALSKKSETCRDLQTKLSVRTRQFTADEVDKQNLKNELTILANNKAQLDTHTNELEKIINQQYGQIKDLEKLFYKEQANHSQVILKREEELSEVERKLQEGLLKIEQLHNEMRQQNQKEEAILEDQKEFKKKTDEAQAREQRLHTAALEEQHVTLLHSAEQRIQREMVAWQQRTRDAVQVEVRLRKRDAETWELEKKKLQAEIEKLGVDVSNEKTSSKQQLEAFEKQLKQLQGNLDEKEREGNNLEGELSQVKEQFKMDYQQMESRNNDLLVAIGLKDKEIGYLNETLLVGKGEIAKSNEEISGLKNKLHEQEKNMKCVALELVEESTKLTVISGSTPPTKIKYSSPNRSTNENFLAEAMNVFRAHLEHFRNFTLSLRHENESLLLNNDELASFGASSQSSAKLLRHLQQRLKMLRKENETLRENHAGNIREDYQTSIEIGLQTRIHDLESRLQRQEKELQQKTSDLMSMQLVLSQATKENMKLEKSYARLQDMLGQGEAPITSHFSMLPSMPATHLVSLGPTYPGTALTKAIVPEDSVPWWKPCPDYNPCMYTDGSVLVQPAWADPGLRGSSLQKHFNSMDGNVNRKSYMGHYAVVDGYPRNPVGRTGMIGRGLLGRWGPNHAADPVLTRWARESSGEIMTHFGKPVLEFVAVQRKDSGQWAIPGGMVDAGEKISNTLKREFSEEALGMLSMSETEKLNLQTKINRLFSNGTLIYKGYVDDPRNTDNAWMETVVVNVHDDDGSSIGVLTLHAGDDAKNVRWVRVDRRLDLYANHSTFIQQVCQYRNAYEVTY